MLVIAVNAGIEINFVNKRWKLSTIAVDRVFARPKLMTSLIQIACVAGVRRGRKEERRVREAREDRTREDRGRGRLQGRYCFLYSAL